MEDTNNFEAITLSNIWIKEHILDIIKAINVNEIIAETGSSDLFALNDMEMINILKTRIDALKLMKAYILQLRDNVAQYIKPQLKFIDLKLIGIDNHEQLLQNNFDSINNADNFFLSPHFDEKLNKLRKIKRILIDACGEAELLTPKKDEQVKGKIMEDLE
jgi:hypothetical protein